MNCLTFSILAFLVLTLARGGSWRATSSARKDQQIKEAVPVGRIVDFALLREALNELGTR